MHLVGCLSLPSSQWVSVIRHVAPIPSHYDVQDRFRIELSEEGAEGRVVGRKDVTSVLRAPAYPLELQGHSEPTPMPYLSHKVPLLLFFPFLSCGFFKCQEGVDLTVVHRVRFSSC